MKNGKIVNDDDGPYLTNEEQRRKIIELFDKGMTYSQIRNELWSSSYDFPPFKVFLDIIGASSERDYRRIHANIERARAGYFKKGRSGMHVVPPLDAEEEDWSEIRKRVLESNLGACLFCDRNAEEVHNVLGNKEEKASNYLIPVCKDHLGMLNGKEAARDGQEVRRMAARMALIYPRLFFMVRKSIRAEDGDVMSYAVVRIRNREQAVLDDDPCPGWKAFTLDEDQGERGCAILRFDIFVSDKSFDLRLLVPAQR